MPQVQSGQTASGIAQAAGLTPSQFLELNPTFAAKGNVNDFMGLSGLIKPGQEYITSKPAPETVVPPPAVGTSDAAKKKMDEINAVINPVVPASPTTDTKKKVEDIQTGLETEYDTYKERIGNINKGQLTPQEQAMLDNAQKIFDQNRRAQELVNKNYEAGITISGIRAGRQRYATEIEQGNIKNAIDQGIQKIQELDAKAAQTISAMRQSMLDKNYEKATKEFDTYQKFITAKQNNIFALDELARKDQQFTFDQLREQNRQKEEENRLIADSNKDTRTSAIKEYEYAKEQGYTGSFMDYEKSQQAAKKAISSPSVLTQDEANRYRLPTALVGKTDLDIMQDLAVTYVPDWFQQMLQETEPGKVFSKEGLQQVWNDFRNSESMNVYRNMADINKAYSGKLQAEGLESVDVDLSGDL